MIESFIDGRIRIRDAQLKDPDQLIAYQTLLQSIDGVLSVSANSKTGSMLISYDPALIPRSQIEDIARQMGGLLPPVSAVSTREEQPHPHKKKKFSRKQRTLIRYGLLASLVSTAVFAYTNRPMHHVTALVFVGFALTHLTMYRKTFLK